MDLYYVVYSYLLRKTPVYIRRVLLCHKNFQILPPVFTLSVEEIPYVTNEIKKGALVTRHVWTTGEEFHPNFSAPPPPTYRIRNPILIMGRSSIEKCENAGRQREGS